MDKKVTKMLRQILKSAKNAGDFAAIERTVSDAHAQARTQPEYWRVALPGQVKDATFPEFGLPVLPMQVIALDLDKEEIAKDD